MECLLCGLDFFLWETRCYSLMGCLAFSYFQGCSACRPGYVLNERFCVAADDNCQRYVGGTCGSCVSGYRLNPSTNRCEEAETRNCKEYNLGICSECNPGYKLRADFECEVENCQQYQAATLICERCLSGFYLSRQGLCPANPPNCL